MHKQTNLSLEKEEYFECLKIKINRLNQLSKEQYDKHASLLLKSLLQIDIKFIRKNNRICNAHFLFTRHGKCENWSDKKFGMNPNSCLAEQAVQALQQTKKLTQIFLLFPEHPIILGVSPLVRAKETACLMKPNKKVIEGAILPYLSQNSKWPSGCNLDSIQCLEKHINDTNFWKNPLRKTIYLGSKLFFSDQQTYQKIRQKSQKADKQLIGMCKISQDYFKGGKYDQKTKRYKFDTNLQKQQKIAKLLQMLKNGNLQQRDTWLFGHSGNFTAFFHFMFSFSDMFKYCETRRIYRLTSSTQNQEKWTFFHPPYDFYVDQHNGRVKAIYDQNRFKFAFKL